MKKQIQRFIIGFAVIFILLGTFSGEGVSPFRGIVCKASLPTVTGKEINDGVYLVEVESSSSMFRVVKAELTVKNGEMRAILTLSGTGYEKLFMGTGEEAKQASEDDFIYFVEDAKGAYTYEIPVEALNREFDCAAFSIRKQKWYDRTLVILLESLPEGAMDETFAPVSLADGSYEVEVVLSGGSGKASIKSPTELIIEDGKARATIEWSSPNYDYMRIGSMIYRPVQTEGNSTFHIPVAVWNEEMAVIGDTTAMSMPHEVEYTLTFDVNSIKKAGSSQKKMTLTIVSVVVCLLGIGGIAFFGRRKKKQL